MDVSAHLTDIRDRRPYFLPVDSVGLARIPARMRITRHDQFNFVFVLKGEGSLSVNGGRAWDLRAPCVVVQIPGVQTCYETSGDWEELYIMYDPKLLPVFQRIGVPVDPKKPMWDVACEEEIREVAARVVSLASRFMEHGNADRLDRLCEYMISMSLQGPGPGASLSGGDLARSVAAEMETRVCEDVVVEEIVRSRGVSYSSFIRAWRKVFQVTPKYYMLSVKMREAARMLTETDLKVREVASRLGYRDPLYFSKVFREATGTPASQYRRRIDGD